MEYFDIPVVITVAATDLEEAQMRAWFFMPWTNDGIEWTTKQHKYINGEQIDGWHIDGIDSSEMESNLIKWGVR